MHFYAWKKGLKTGALPLTSNRFLLLTRSQAATICARVRPLMPSNSPWMLPLQVSRPSHHAAAAAAAAATASPASPDVGIGKTSDGATPKSKEQNMADMVRLRRGCGLLLLLQAAVNLVTRHSRAGVQSDQQGGVHGMQLVAISIQTGHHCQAFANHFLPSLSFPSSSLHHASILVPMIISGIGRLASQLPFASAIYFTPRLIN